MYLLHVRECLGTKLTTDEDILHGDCCLVAIIVYNLAVCHQAMSPLGLVQAARKARGESTDVGSEEDLWGKSKGDDYQVVGLSL